jgi:hypothetical protein
MPEARQIDYFEIVTADIWKPSMKVKPSDISKTTAATLIALSLAVLPSAMPAQLKLTLSRHRTILVLMELL